MSHLLDSSLPLPKVCISREPEAGVELRDSNVGTGVLTTGLMHMRACVRVCVCSLFERQLWQKGREINFLPTGSFFKWLQRLVQALKARAQNSSWVCLMGGRGHLGHLDLLRCISRELDQKSELRDCTLELHYGMLALLLVA